MNKVLLKEYLKIALEDLEFHEDNNNIDVPVAKYYLGKAFKMLK